MSPVRFHYRVPALLAGLWVWLSAPVTLAQVPSPTLEGPIHVGSSSPWIASTNFDLGLVGYTQDEYFVSGTARSFTNSAPLTSDGVWTVTPADSTEYKTRILVNRPIKRGHFNGTVMVEWLNVSGGLDASPDWTMAHTELIRRGYAWVGVSAQFVGVEGGGGISGLPDLSLKAVNSNRYGSLNHPGDSFSYDIFSQIGQAILNPTGVRPLGDLALKRLIAVGESQSAFRLTTYVNAIHPLAEIYDGFLIHSRGASSAALSQEPQANIVPPGRVLIRTDQSVPVLTFQAETDLVLLRSFFDRQPDSEFFRLWEVAGTAHADTYTLVLGGTDLGDDPNVANLLITSAPIPGLIECELPINSGPQHFVFKAAVHVLERWVRLGKPPKPAPRLVATAGSPPVIARDEHGNALGGIRTPQVDVPIAALSGSGQSGSLLCMLFGTTVPFAAETLAELYPTHRVYIKAFNAATRRSAKAGWLRWRDARLMQEAAKASDIGE